MRASGGVKLKSTAKKALRKVVPPYVRRALRILATEVKLARAHSKARKSAQSLSAAKNLRLNFGSGSNLKSGWVNIDAFSPSSEHHWDARRQMPLADGSCSMIYSEHLLEHLDYSGAMSFFQESYRVLNS